MSLQSQTVPDWLATQVTAQWLDRYSHRIEEYRLPKGVEARQRYAEQIGAGSGMATPVLF